jgi:uncharacterized OsmC-like protein
MQTSIVRNGVDVKRLKETIQAVQAQPDLANFRFRLSNEWINGGHNQSVIKDFYGAGKEDKSRKEAFIYSNDEPDVLLGQDNGANPVEYVLHALAGCLTTSLVYHASARGYKIERVSSKFEGDLDLRGFLGIDSSVRNGYSEIRVEFDIEGDFTEEQKQEILQYGPRFSPVFDIVTNPVQVKLNLKGA